MVTLSIPSKLTSDRLIFQRLRYEDAEEIFYTYASKPVATRFVSWKTHKSVDDTRLFLSYAIRAWNEDKEYSFSVRLRNSNRLIGSIGVINDSGRVQFGYIFSPTQWNRGYATEACRRILEHLKTEKHITKITTFVDVDNKASIQVLKNCGLREEGIFSQWFKFPNQDDQSKDCLLFHYPL
jgi:[ribosomal protein S5]-alanine N-acetyltransferase